MMMMLPQECFDRYRKNASIAVVRTVFCERRVMSMQVGLARVMEKQQYRSSDDHGWTFVYGMAHRIRPFQRPFPSAVSASIHAPDWQARPARLSSTYCALFSDAACTETLSEHLHRPLPAAAPEMLMGKPCSAASDIYSLGVCLWEVVTRCAPYLAHSAERDLLPVVRGLLTNVRYPSCCLLMLCPCAVSMCMVQPTALLSAMCRELPMRGRLSRPSPEQCPPVVADLVLQVQQCPSSGTCCRSLVQLGMVPIMPGDRLLAGCAASKLAVLLCCQSRLRMYLKGLSRHVIKLLIEWRQ